MNNFEDAIRGITQLMNTKGFCHDRDHPQLFGEVWKAPRVQLQLKLTAGPLPQSGIFECNSQGFCVLAYMAGTYMVNLYCFPF